MDETESKILAHISRPNYNPTRLRALAKALDMAQDNYGEYRAAVKRLLHTGAIELGKGKTIRKAGPGTAEAHAPIVSRIAPDKEIRGTFKRSSKGFGFVRPLGGPSDRTQDIFIPPPDALDASTGDEVAIVLTRKAKGPGLNAQGRIVKVLTRAAGQFVGTYLERGRVGFVEVDGTVFSEPIPVGDPGAKGVRPGDKVAIELARYPTADRSGQGVIVEVLGPRGKPGVDTLTVIRAHNLPDAFDDDVIAEAREQARRFSEDEIGPDRDDLRERLVVTIDPSSAHDFDDAISLDRDEKGHWSLAVHVADVSHFVPAGSALDRSAKLRGTSVYLPGRVLPMLPEVISNSLASLQAEHVRYAVTAFIELDPEGIVTETRFARTAIRPRQRFSYEQAMEVMASPLGTEWPDTDPEVVALLRRMLTLAMILRNRRFTRGALELTMPEVSVALGEQGEVTGAHLNPRDASHQVIEEFMLAANEAVARFLQDRKIAFLRRGHADPEPRKLRVFAEFVRSLGLTISNPESRFELQRILDETVDRPERHAVHYALLRSLKQANYTPEPVGHYALASDHYCHFTSPIRRYPDLQVHRQLLAVLAGKRPKGDTDELLALAEHCTRTERRAEAAERELVRIKLLTHLQGRIGETFHAVIIGVEEFGLFCLLKELPVEGLLHVNALDNAKYYLEPESYTLIGRRGDRRFRLGDTVTVRIAKVDVDRRTLDLSPVIEGLEAPSGPAGDDIEREFLPPSRSRPRPTETRARPRPRAGTGPGEPKESGTTRKPTKSRKKKKGGR